MPWFIKTETFTADTVALSFEQRRPHLEAHRDWVTHQSQQGRTIRSGFLVDAQRRPGGGGLLIFEAESFEAAMRWVRNVDDPRRPVDWQLQEWIPVSGDGWP